MKRVLIKLCGITEKRDALEAAHLGVDALGFHFSSQSPLCIDPDAARSIVERLPVFVAKVGVFIDEPIIKVLEIARKVGLTAVQLQGSEPAVLCEAISPLPWYKALRMGPSFDPSDLSRYSCTTFLLDGSSSYDWRMARPLSLFGRILIAGGLDPTNVGPAIEAARPYGVDVSSGVEFAPGKKDLDRVELFVEAVHEVERRL